LVYAPDGTTSLSESAKRGKRLFDSAAGCAVCHPAPLFTDLRLHDVDTQSPGDFEPLYDTPTLIEVWRTAPYLHDGRYKTLRELIVDGKHVNTKGQLDKLSETEIDDLIDYVLSL
jgi:cytochrome c peroxidase